MTDIFPLGHFEGGVDIPSPPFSSWLASDRGAFSICPTLPFLHPASHSFDDTKQCGGGRKSFELRGLGVSPNPILDSLYDLHQGSSPISICLTRGLGNLRFPKGRFADHSSVKVFMNGSDLTTQPFSQGASCGTNIHGRFFGEHPQWHLLGEMGQRTEYGAL